MIQLLKVFILSPLFKSIMMSYLWNFPNLKISGMLCLLGIFFLLSCSKEDIDMVDCMGLVPTYNLDVKAILDNSCATVGCHNSTTKENGIDLSTYASVRVVSSQDRFLGAIQHKRGYTAMPYKLPELNSDQVELLTCWVQNGSPE
jgi:hypothetical protein